MTQEKTMSQETTLFHETTMTMVSDTLVDELGLVLSRACIELARARSRQSEKDTPAHRAAVARCRAEIDTLLDCYADSCDLPR
jgi:hypothetical protein